jgi:hypothetical protein
MMMMMRRIWHNGEQLSDLHISAGTEAWVEERKQKF